MRKSLAYFFLTCSLILVIGHSVLPHNHDKLQIDGDQVSQKVDFTLADIIKITLSHNLGINHLEEYTSYDSLDFSKTTLQSEIIEAIIIDFSVQRFANTLCCPARSVHLRSQLEPLTTTERGPPSLS